MLQTAKRVALLHGGPSSEHNVSLQSAAAVRSALEDTWHEVVDIYIDKTGQWHRDGRQKPIDRALIGVDHAFIALHGTYGEDGQIQKILETHNYRYNGARSHSARTAFNKITARDIFQKVGLQIPQGTTITSANDIEIVFPTGSYHDLDHKLVIKPACDGSSIGITITDNWHTAKQAARALWHASQKPILIEGAVPGREFTVGVVAVADDRHYALPTIEITPPSQNGWFDYDAKYSGQSIETCPANIDSGLDKKLKTAAITAHEALQIDDYSRSDFIITEDDQIYILETNTLPGLTAKSLFPKALSAAGTSLQSWLLHLI